MANQRGRPMKARPRILQAACDLFLEQGLDVSLDTIISTAGISRPTLYSHFPGGKDALLVEAFSFLNDRMQPPLQKMVTDNADDLPALLLGFAKVVQEHFYAPEHIHFQRLLIQVLVQKPELYATLKQRPTGRVLQALAEILKQYQEQGRIQLDNPTLQATAFLGAIMGYSFPGALIDQQPLDSRGLAQLAHSAVNTFLIAWRYH